jgi:hypothetical protein
MTRPSSIGPTAKSFIDEFDRLIGELLQNSNAEINVSHLFGDNDWWLAMRQHPRGTPDELLFEVLRQNLVNVEPERAILESRHRKNPYFPIACVRLVDAIQTHTKGYLSRRQSAFVCNAKATALRAVAYMGRERSHLEAGPRAIAWYDLARRLFQESSGMDHRVRHINWLCGCLRFDLEGGVEGIRQAASGVAGHPQGATIGIYFGLATRLFQLPREAQLEILASIKPELLLAYCWHPSVTRSSAMSEQGSVIPDGIRMAEQLRNAGIVTSLPSSQEPIGSTTIRVSAWSRRLLDRFAICTMLSSCEESTEADLFSQEIGVLLEAADQQAPEIGLSPLGVEAVLREARRLQKTRISRFDDISLGVEDIVGAAREAFHCQGLVGGLRALQPSIASLRLNDDRLSRQQLCVLLLTRIFFYQEGGEESLAWEDLDEAMRLAASTSNPFLILRCNVQASRLFRLEQNTIEQQRCFDLWQSICVVVGRSILTQSHFPVGAKGRYAPSAENALKPREVPEVIRNFPNLPPAAQRMEAYRLYGYLAWAPEGEQERRIRSVLSSFDRNPASKDIFPLPCAVPPSLGLMSLLARGEGEFSHQCLITVVPILCRELSSARYESRRQVIRNALGKIVPKYFRSEGVPPSDLLHVSHSIKTGALLEPEDSSTFAESWQEATYSGIEAFQEALTRKNACLLDYHPGPNGSVLLIWTGEGVRRIDLGLSSDDVNRYLRKINYDGDDRVNLAAQGLEAVDHYIRGLGTDEERAARSSTAMQHWRELSPMLLPLAAVEAIAAHDHVIVCPAAIVSRVPIHLLLVNGHPLLSLKSVTYVQSPLYALWVAPEEQADQRWYSLANSEGLDVLQSLDMDNWWNHAESPEQRIRRMADCGSALLICHGTNHEQSTNNRLCFARGGRLSNSDLSNGACRPLTGQRVLLIACHSAHATRNIVGGSVVHNLLKLGAGTVLGCLWAVEVESAKAFVKEITAKVKSGIELPQAYRQAYIEIAAKEPDDFMKILVGAPYVMMG